MSNDHDDEIIPPLVRPHTLGWVRVGRDDKIEVWEKPDGSYHMHERLNGIMLVPLPPGRRRKRQTERSS